jgi:triacylglycerol esterase/lipase EstA (alpha/beta hydrolase family)
MHRLRPRLLAALVVLTLATGGLAGGAAPAASAATTRNPVLVTAGLSSPGFSVDLLAARLRADGWRVYTLDPLPGLGFGDIGASANAVATKVAAIRAETGAAKVDLVGHSEGGLVNRYFLRFLGGTSVVGRYVSLGTPQHGTALANLGVFFANCFAVVACQQMAIGSSFLANLNSGDETPGSVAYTAIATAQDELVQPVSTAYLQDGATNVKVQSYCWLRVVGHLGLVIDGAVYGLVRSALKGGSIGTNCFAL